MRIAFYGTSHGVGTSANLAAVTAGLSRYRKNLALAEHLHAKGGWREEAIMLKDCGIGMDADEKIKSCDLLVLNLSVPSRELDQIYLSHFLVRKNVIFLVGKYYPEPYGQLERVAGRYRINRSRICAIPYNPRFAKAYEEKSISAYLDRCGQAPRGGGDSDFECHLKRAVGAIITYGNRKGEQYYG